MSARRSVLLAVLVYLGLTLALTYPLVTALATAVPSDPGDPLLNAWILWWNAQAMPFTTAWWNAPAFAPSTDVLALSEHLLGLTPLTSPIIWLTSNPQLAYNIAFLATFVLSAAGGYGLGYALTGRTDAAFITGLAYGFAPYRMAQFPHIQTLASFWMPIALIGLHYYLRDGRLRWLALFGVATVLQALTNGYYLLFFPVLIGCWIFWFLCHRDRRRAFAGAVMTCTLAYVLLAPMLLHYVEVHQHYGFRREINEIVSLSADLTALLHAAPELVVWGRILPAPAPEAQLFPGLTVILLMVAGLALRSAARPQQIVVATGRPWTRVRVALAILAVPPTLAAICLPIFGPWRVDLLGASLSVSRLSRPVAVAFWLWLSVILLSPRMRAVRASRSPLAFYVAAAIAMWVLAFGPQPALAGERVFYWAPYRWLMMLPGFDGVRVPARFTMLAVLCIAAAAGLALARVQARLSTRRQRILAIAASLGILADGWLTAMPLATQPPPSIVTTAAAPGAVLELPLPDVDVAAMHRGISHRHPVANGFSGYNPPAYDVLRAAADSRDPTLLAALATAGVRHVVVFKGESDDDWDEYVTGYAAATLVRSADGQTHYQLGGAPAAAPARAHRTLPIQHVTAGVRPDAAGRLMDGDLTTIWETGAPQAGSAAEMLEVDIGSEQTVDGVEIAIGRLCRTYPRELQIEVSGEGGAWQPVWHGHTGGLAFAGALGDPRRAPVRVEFAPVSARRIRVRQLGTARDPWSVAELTVLGPVLP